jgi:hypothetical protein
MKFAMIFDNHLVSIKKYLTSKNISYIGFGYFPLLPIALQLGLGAVILILTSGLFVLFGKFILGSMGLVMLFLPIAWTLLLGGYPRHSITFWVFT